MQDAIDELQGDFESGSRLTLVHLGQHPKFILGLCCRFCRDPQGSKETRLSYGF